MRNRRDRERQSCPACGKDVTVRRDGGLMAHRTADGRSDCVSAAWRQRNAATYPAGVIEELA